MEIIDRCLRGFAYCIEKLEEKTKALFVIIAVLLYAGSLVLLARKVSPVSNLDTFLVKALGNLTIPFGVILLQEFLELLTTISKNVLKSTSHQFEIVALVILRSFFKDFYKLNEAVAAGSFEEPAQKALVKVLAIVLITVLIFAFKRLSERAGIERRNTAQKQASLWKQAVVVMLCLGVLAYMAFGLRSFSIMAFISLVFTGMIVVDAVFFLWSILKSHEFDTLMFDGGLVVSLILARFPLFAGNILSYSLAVVGVAFATVGLKLFVRPTELEFLGDPSEDEVSRLDFMVKNHLAELAAVNDRAGGFLRQFSLDDPTLKKIRLATDELLTNIMAYSHADDAEHEIAVGLAIYGDRLAITVSDDGKPFNPFRGQTPDTRSALEQRAIGGLGVHLVRNVMDRVSYRREAGRNVVTLLKNLSGGQPEKKAVPVEDRK